MQTFKVGNRDQHNFMFRNECLAMNSFSAPNIFFFTTGSFMKIFISHLRTWKGFRRQERPETEPNTQQRQQQHGSGKSAPRKCNWTHRKERKKFFFIFCERAFPTRDFYIARFAKIFLPPVDVQFLIKKVTLPRLEFFLGEIAFEINCLKHHLCLWGYLFTFFKSCVIFSELPPGLNEILYFYVTKHPFRCENSWENFPLNTIFGKLPRP